MPQAPTFVVVGAGQAGGRAVETLRQEGFDGRIVLLGAELERPYERPPLSKDVLRGEAKDEKVFLRPPEYYDDQKIELRLGSTAQHLRPSDQAVDLTDG